MAPLGDILKLGARQRLELYHTLLSDPDQSALIGAWEWDLQTNTTIWSQNTYQILDFSPEIEQITEDMVLRHVHPDDLERVQRMFQEAMERGEAPPIEYRVVVRGRTRRIRARGQALRDERGQVVKLVGTVADISHQEPLAPPWLRNLELLEPSQGNGGLLRLHQVQISLSLLQFALLQALLRRYEEDQGLSEELRGYVPSAQLLATLPWETPHPGAANLKQNIRRTRALLKGSGLWIQAARGLGYRLQARP